MNDGHLKFRRTALSLAIAMTMTVAGVHAAPRVDSASTTITMDNLVGDYDGTMLSGTLGNGQDDEIVCGASTIYPGSPDCPTVEIEPGVEHPQPIEGTEADVLYPIDSTFGFDVVPFAEAFDKERGDDIWGEGWVGNIYDDDGVTPIGVEFSDAKTDTFLVPDGRGTWCTGLGGASVKCSTEHFVTMEAVLTCHETIPYYNADPVSGEQLKILDGDGNVLVDCADTKLDNNLLVLNDSNPYVNNRMTGPSITLKDGTLVSKINWAQPFLEPDDILTFLEANESTALDDIMFGNDYSVTAKDDGKALYRWGNLIKRPNDIRIYARMELPVLWKGLPARSANGGKGFRVTKAHLTINHKITNNPNDQIRAEDMENEGAIGRLPGYTESGDNWLSDRDCYQGNGLFIGTGTTLRNGDLALPPTPLPTGWDNNPYVWSEDLAEGFTNAWYTTVDREPFEWSYDTTGNGIDDVSFREPQDPAPGTLLSGPRWRLTPPKFGQDIPGLEIPGSLTNPDAELALQCSPPPYQKAQIKYTVGDPVTTVLDLLDWSPDDERSVDGESPLVWSRGWTTPALNDGAVVNRGVNVVNGDLTAVSVNGAPISSDFDLSIYIKGDRKPTAIYNAKLDIEWDDAQNWAP